MAVRLVLAPANSGKTRYCLERIQATRRAAPFASIWVVLPNRTQAVAFRRRLALAGGGLGVQVGTFGDLYAEILSGAGEPIPVAPGPLLDRVLRAAIDALSAQGGLRHYAPIQRRPGFVRALSEFIAELKRFRIEPPQFEMALAGRGPRLEELGALYREYQAALIRLGWADDAGLGWLAVQALQDRWEIGAKWALVIADGFDSFDPTQLITLKALSGRAADFLVTLSGEPDMTRTAHRRFARTLERIQAALRPEAQQLEIRPVQVPPLAHLEAALFDADPLRQPAANRVGMVEAQTPALEARAALRWLKARIIRDAIPPEQCAVIALDISPYQAFLAEVAREFGLPLRLAEGEPLERNAAIAAVLNVLELPLQRWARGPVLEALRCPYFDLATFGFGAEAAAELNEAAHAGQIVEGLDQWQDALARLEAAPSSDSPIEVERDDGSAEARPPRVPTGSRAAALRAGLAAFAGRVSPPAKAPAREYAAWVEGLLGDDGLGVATRGARQPSTAARDAAALDSLRAALSALVLAEQVVNGQPEITFADFYAELRGAAASATYAPEGRAAARGVYVANLSAARGVTFRAVAVLGLSEGLFPAPLAEDPFLSDDERAALQKAGLPLEPRLRSDQQTLFYEAVTRASDYLLLTRPYLSEDGEAWEPSPYWQAARALFEAAPQRVRAEDPIAEADAASRVELLASAAQGGRLPEIGAELAASWQQLERSATVLRAHLARSGAGVYEGDVSEVASSLAARYGPEYVWSASRLETFGACAFRFYTGTVLDLELREAPTLGYDAAQLGGMLHEILEKVHQHSPDPGDLGALGAALPEVAREVFAAAPQRYGFRPSALWEMEQAEWIEALQATVQALAGEAGGFRPAQFEARFGYAGTVPLALDTAVGPVCFHGQIDRVDVDDDGHARIIDYKSRGAGVTARDLLEGRRLQLPLYALAAEQALGVGEVAEGFYWDIRRAAASSLRLQRLKVPDDHPSAPGASGPAAAMAIARHYVAQYVAAIRAGSFPPQAPPGGCPEFCAARLFCWRYEARSY